MNIRKIIITNIRIARRTPLRRRTKVYVYCNLCLCFACENQTNSQYYIFYCFHLICVFNYKFALFIEIYKVANIKTQMCYITLDISCIIHTFFVESFICVVVDLFIANLFRNNCQLRLNTEDFCKLLKRVVVDLFIRLIV